MYPKDILKVKMTTLSLNNAPLNFIYRIQKIIKLIKNIQCSIIIFGINQEFIREG